MHSDLKMEKWYNNRLMLDISEKGGTIKFGPYWFLKIAGWCRLLNNCLAIGQQQNGHIWLLRVRKRKKYFEIAATFLNSKQENSRAQNFNEIKNTNKHISVADAKQDISSNIPTLYIPRRKAGISKYFILFRTLSYITLAVTIWPFILFVINPVSPQQLHST